MEVLKIFGDFAACCALFLRRSAAKADTDKGFVRPLPQEAYCAVNACCSF